MLPSKLLFYFNGFNSAILALVGPQCRLQGGTPVFVYVDKGDEVIGWQGSATKHSLISRFTVFEGGCHGFDHFREALLDFDAASTK